VAPGPLSVPSRVGLDGIGFAVHNPQFRSRVSLNARQSGALSDRRVFKAPLPKGKKNSPVFCNRAASGLRIGGVEGRALASPQPQPKPRRALCRALFKAPGRVFLVPRLVRSRLPFSRLAPPVLKEAPGMDNTQTGPALIQAGRGLINAIQDKNKNIFIPPAPRPPRQYTPAKRPAGLRAGRGSFSYIHSTAGFAVKAFSREASNLRSIVCTPKKLLPSKLRHSLATGCFFSHTATFQLPHAVPPPLARSYCSLKLSEDGSRLLSEPNAGGNSVTSEVASFEILRRVFSNASLHKTEMEIKYAMAWDGVRPMGMCMSTKTDFVLSVPSVSGGIRLVAVSVTRAMHYPRKHHPAFTIQDASRLLNKKLKCVCFSDRYVVEKDKWDQQVLHVLTDDYTKARLLKKAFRKIDPELRQNTIVVVTVTKNARFLFVNDKHMMAVAEGSVVWNSDLEPQSPTLSSTDSENDESTAAIHVPFALCASA